MLAFSGLTTRLIQASYRICKAGSVVALAQCLFNDTVDLLHDWWSTVAFFSGFPVEEGLHKTR